MRDIERALRSVFAYIDEKEKPRMLLVDIRRMKKFLVSPRLLPSAVNILKRLKFDAVANFGVPAFAKPVINAVGRLSNNRTQFQVFSGRAEALEYLMMMEKVLSRSAKRTAK
jgi:hypothetical protein